jgi:CubicO group peptidase (beta-lactamase class C family)
VAEQLVRDGVAPSAAAGCAAASASGELAPDYGGATDTYFDLASLTKPMTALAIAWSGMDRRARLADYLPHLSKRAAGAASIETLLAHRAGLVDHLDLRDVPRSEALERIADARRPDARGEIPEGGFPPVYSDLGYILAGAALAEWAGTPDAGRAIERIVARRMGIDVATAATLEGAGVDLARRAAPTEHAAWRGGVVRGLVHDENAWVLTGSGGSGHAGMFGTIAGVVGFAWQTMIALERDPSLAWLVAPRPGGTLRAGFDGKSPEGSSAGEKMGANAFGHLGFTGTSFWIDPDARVVVALLTNRVHPTRDNVAIRAARPAAHDALYERALEIRSRGRS